MNAGEKCWVTHHPVLYSGTIIEARDHYAVVSVEGALGNQPEIVTYPFIHMTPKEAAAACQRTANYWTIKAKELDEQV